MIAQLIPADGSQPISITRDVTLVGRKKEICDVILDSNSISKVHCAIAKTDGLLFFRDLGSTNGTKVNGQRVMRGALLPGDELCFANMKFRIHLGPAVPVSPISQRTEALRTFPKTQRSSDGSFNFVAHGNEMLGEPERDPTPPDLPKIKRPV